MLLTSRAIPGVVICSILKSPWMKQPLGSPREAPSFLGNLLQAPHLLFKKDQTCSEKRLGLSSLAFFGGWFSERRAPVFIKLKQSSWRLMASHRPNGARKKSCKKLRDDATGEAGMSFPRRKKKRAVGYLTWTSRGFFWDSFVFFGGFSY